MHNKMIPTIFLIIEKIDFWKMGTSVFVSRLIKQCSTFLNGGQFDVDKVQIEVDTK